MSQNERGQVKTGDRLPAWRIALGVGIVAQVALLIIIAGLLAHAQANPQPEPERALTPCVTEDSGQCWWDAHAHGNDAGRSFVVVDGVTYYLND